MCYFLKKITFFLPGLIIFLPNLVLAGDYGINKANEAAKLPTNIAQATDVPGLVGVIVGAGLSLLGIIFFLLVLYSGFRWMTAMGKQEDIQKAKDTLEAAAIGLVLVLAAYAITRFVFTGLGVAGATGAAPGGCAITCGQDGIPTSSEGMTRDAYNQALEPTAPAYRLFKDGACPAPQATQADCVRNPNR